MCDAQNEKVVKLSRYITPSRCVAFIGSGLSRGIYDSWVDLVKNLCDKCGVEPEAPITKISKPMDLLKAAEAAREANERAYCEYLGQHFGRIHKTNPLYDLLMRCQFKSYLTLNFDPLLAYESRKPEHNCNKVMKYPDLDRENIGKKTIFYLHGLIDENETPNANSIVLTDSDFREAYGDNSSLLNFLIPTFVKDQILFIGCGLREYVFQEVFAICREQRDDLRKRAGGKVPPRIILLPKKDYRSAKADGSGINNTELQREAENNEDQDYGKHDIQVLRYQKIDNEHTGLRKPFESLADLHDSKVVFGFNGGDI